MPDMLSVKGELGVESIFCVRTHFLSELLGECSKEQQLESIKKTRAKPHKRFTIVSAGGMQKNTGG